MTTKILNFIRLIKLDNFNYIKVDDYDAVYSPMYAPLGYIKNNKKIKKIIFIHDTIPFSRKDEYLRLHRSNAWFEDVLNYAKTADLCFVNSNYTKQDILKYLPELNPDKIKVVYLGADDNFKCIKNPDIIAAMKEKYGIEKDKKYILSLCNLEPRKNLMFALNNFVRFVKQNDICNLVFVIGGTNWEGYCTKEIDELNNSAGKKLIYRTGYVEDAYLSALYSGSEMFIYPSLFEGFGMPVLEAMQCGCPIIVSNRTSLREVAADAGILINPESDVDILQAYKKMYFNNKFRKECSERSILQAQKFSWKKCAKIISDAIIYDL